MKRKIVGILVVTLLIATAVLPAVGNMNVSKNKSLKSGEGTGCGCFNSLNDCDCCPPCMKSYWKLDGDSGAVVDCFDGNDGTNHGATRSIPGQVGKAFSFNGLNDYVMIPQPYSSSLNLGTGAFTLEAWINPDQNQVLYPTILSNRGDDEYNGFLFGLSLWDGAVQGSLFLQIDGVNYIPCSKDLRVNGWHHVAVTRTGNSITFYVDGSQDGTANSGKNMNSDYDTWIGWDEAKPSTTPWAGKIDEVAVYGCCLPASTIKCHYQRGLAHQGYCGYCHDYKMHFPQLPDEDGWDVYCRNGWTYLADDWGCSESGHVKDIHFWGSWKDDQVCTIDGFHIWIAEPDPLDPCQPNTGNHDPYDFNALWYRYFTDFEVSDPIIPGCLEGWYDPMSGSYEVGNHGKYYQYDIVNIADPFYQQKGEKYWLMIAPDYYWDNCSWGWKSSEDHWGCDAVQSHHPEWENWKELYEPPSFEDSLDLAFVITGGCCIDPPDDLIAWWPLDWPPTPLVYKDIVGTYSGYRACGGIYFPDLVAGKVDGACRFTHGGHGGHKWGVIRTPDGIDPFVKIDKGDFTIDAWIYPEEVNSGFYCWSYNKCQRRIIMCNQGGRTDKDYGINFYVINTGWDGHSWTSMELGLAMNDGSTSPTWWATSSAPIVLDEWQHVAVTVDRAKNGVTFYYNGDEHIETFSKDVPQGILYYTNPVKGFPKLDIGHGRPSICGTCGCMQEYFNGLLDEVELFNRALTVEEIKEIYNADGNGKCKQYGGKMVSTDNGETWHERVNADVDETVRFKIMTVNSGKKSIDNVEVIDTLPDCLEYVEGSAEPVEPTVQGNNLTWNYEYISVGETEEIQFDALISMQPFDPFQYNFIEISGKSAGTILLFDDTATVIIGETVPDLKCSGSLSWSDIKPGATVGGSFSVENVGEIDSNLYWDIASLPDWGTWTITPFCGENLKPEDGPVEVDVEVEVPDEQNAEFSGGVKIVNRDDPADNCTIPVSLTTPKNKAINTPFMQFLESLLQNHPYMFPVLRQLLQLQRL